MPESFKELLSFSQGKEKEELKILPYFYQIELNETRKELIQKLYDLREGLHPQFLFGTGERGSLNDVDWLIKHKDKFGSAKEREAYREYRYKLQNLSNGFAEMLFGEFADEPFDSELVYQTAASTFKRMGFRSYVKSGEEKILQLDLTPLGKGLVNYRLVPWTSGMEKNLGKVMDEYYLEKGLRVEIGLKPSVFRSVSTGITTPVHEIIHHVSTLYNSGAYTSAIVKSFNSSFRDIPFFKLYQDRGMAFGSVDNKLRKEMNKIGFDIRGKDVTDPFVLWEIVKRHGTKISNITGVPLNKLYSAAYSYLSNYLPFRILEEGVACYLPIKNANIEKAPKEFSGLDNSLKSLVEFGAKLRKLEYLERGISFYTREKQLANYYGAELQLYPLAYAYVTSQVDVQKPKDVRWYFDLLRNNYLKRNVPIPAGRTIKRRKVEEVSPQLAREKKIQAMINQMNQNIQDYRQRLVEVDKLLKDYKNQLDRTQSLRDSNFISYQPRGRQSQVNRLLNNSRITRSISREINNNELFRTAMYVVAGAIVTYGVARTLNQYLSQ